MKGYGDNMKKIFLFKNLIIMFITVLLLNFSSSVLCDDGFLESKEKEIYLRCS